MSTVAPIHSNHALLLLSTTYYRIFYPFSPKDRPQKCKKMGRGMGRREGYVCIRDNLIYFAFCSDLHNLEHGKSSSLPLPPIPPVILYSNPASHFLGSLTLCSVRAPTDGAAAGDVANTGVGGDGLISPMGPWGTGGTV